MVANAVVGVLDEERLNALRLAVSEVVTNAVQHGSTGDQTIDIALHISTDAIRVTVTQREPVFDRPQRPAPLPSAEGGYGLHLLEVLSNRWGVDASPPPKVWFELDLGSRT
jgi:anti-sigma regulatory factor (Ser/Thr protein kinase)